MFLRYLGRMFLIIGFSSPLIIPFFNRRGFVLGIICALLGIVGFIAVSAYNNRER